MSIKFPAINISIKDWNPEEDYLMYALMDPFIYVKNEQLYNDFYYKNKFVDSEGHVFKIIDREFPTSLWRNMFRFLPNVYKVEFLFQDTGETMSVDEIREFYLRQISRLKREEYVDEWMQQVKDAKTIKGILSGEE